MLSICSNCQNYDSTPALDTNLSQTLVLAARGYTCVLGMLSNFCCFGRNLVLGANYDNFCSLWILTFFCFFRFLLECSGCQLHRGSICTLGPFERFGRPGWLGSGPTICQLPQASPTTPAITSLASIDPCRNSELRAPW